MLYKICKKIAVKISRPESDDIEVVRFGLELLIITALSIIFLLIIGFIFGYGIELTIFLISFGLLRTSAGGLHAKNNIICFISYFSISFLGIKFVKIIPESLQFFEIVTFLLTSMILVYIFAPVQTPSRPIFPKEKLIFRKRSIICICILSALSMLLFFLSFKTLANVMAIAVLFESLTLINFKKTKKLEELK